METSDTEGRLATQVGIFPSQGRCFHVWVECATDHSKKQEQLSVLCVRWAGAGSLPLIVFFCSAGD
jgi:hypothetical protein